MAAQNILSKPPSKVTLLLGIRFALVDEVLKVMVTVAAVVQEHIVREALIKLKRLLHGHVPFTIPAESVKASNVITTAWPLSANLLDIITGAGSTELDDSICTVAVLLSYSAALNPVTDSAMSKEPLMRALADKTKLPVSRDVLV